VYQIRCQNLVLVLSVLYPSLVLAQNLGTAEQIHRFEHAWEAAAARTPHGQPIEVQAQDFGPHMGA
jgi:hypothetical protein